VNKRCGDKGPTITGQLLLLLAKYTGKAGLSGAGRGSVGSQANRILLHIICNIYDVRF
jgi:hypothetical protein